MKRNLIRVLTFLLALLTCSCLLVSCGGKGKALLTLKKDGITVEFSVNEYQFMLSRVKGKLAQYGYQVSDQSFWSQQDKYNGKSLQTLGAFYKDNILDNCRTYVAAMYLFEKEGLKLSEESIAAVDDLMNELLRTDGDNSKTKLNSVLSVYGVNYNMLRDIYLMQEKMVTLQNHLYGKNAELLGSILKEEFLRENYVHFQQIFLPAYSYVFETDKNGDVIYYHAEDGDKKDHIYYDEFNGVPGTDANGLPILDENLDRVYFVNDGQYKTIAYDSVNGKPSYKMSADGKTYQTKDLSAEEKKELKEKADALATKLEAGSYEDFEKAMVDAEKENDETSQTEFLDGYYLKTTIDYSASGENMQYLDEIVKVLKSAENGDVVMVESAFGFHVIKKYPHTEAAYEKEENSTWFEDFNSSLIEAQFQELCKSLYDDILLNESVFATTPSMTDIKINYYY